MRNYELIFIIAPIVADEDVQAEMDKVGDWIKAGEGEVAKVERWGRRQLAYSIKNFREGTYVLMNVRLKPGALDELERSLKLDLNVIRYLLVRTEE